MRFDRLRRLTNLNRRSSIAATTASAAFLLIVGGVALASQTTNGPQITNQAASLFRSASPSNSNSTGSGETGTSGSNAGDASKNNPTQSQQQTPNLPAPTTIIGPHGESIVVSPLGTTASTTPNGQPTTGTTVPTQPSVQPPTSSPSPTTPASVTSTTAPRPASTNGPASPTATSNVTASSPEDPTVSLKVTGADADGYVSSIAIDWNDGSSPTVIPYSLSACTDPESSSRTEMPSHEYTTAGSYNISVTVTSVNCVNDTSQAQQAIAATSVVTGGTSTPPVTTVS